MKKQLVATFSVIVIPFLFASCISTLLKETHPSFSKEISLTDPEKPFTKTDTSIFPSWKNTTTGNVISIISDCAENTSYKLSNLHQLIESGLDDIKLLKEESLTFQKKPALSRIVHAYLDGQPIEIQSVSFKRKSCGYVVTLSGKINNLSFDRPQFEHFINGFRFE